MVHWKKSITFVTLSSCPSSSTSSVALTSYVITGNIVFTMSYALLTTVYTVPSISTFFYTEKNATLFFLFIPFLSQGKHYYKNTLNANSILYNQTCTLSSYLYYNISQSTQVYTQNILHSVCDMCCLYSLSGIKVHNCCRRDWYFYIL